MTASQKISAVACIAAVIALFLLGRSCGIHSVIKNTGTDTTLHSDSVRVISVPIPYLIRYDTTIYKDRLKEITVWDTLWGAQPLLSQIPDSIREDLRQYYATRYYSDTMALKRGKAIINDTVHRNRITGRGFQLNGTDTTIRETITLQAPKSLVLSFMLSGLGDFKMPLRGLEAGLHLKMPNEKSYQVGLTKIWGMPVMGKIGLGIPIRLKKK